MKRPRIAGTGAILLAITTPALADGFNLTQLMGYGFRLIAAVPDDRASAEREAMPRREVLYLQGRLPGGSQDVVMRCFARADPEEGSGNCQQVY